MWMGGGGGDGPAQVMCVLFLGALLPLCTLLGFASAVQDLVEDWDTYGRPFQCHLVGY